MTDSPIDPSSKTYVLTPEQAQDQWRQRLGLQPHERPVSMLDRIETIQTPDGKTGIML